MFDFEDRWWLIAVLLVVLLWVMGAVLPVRMVAPQVSVAEHYVDMDDSPEQDVAPPPRRAGVFLPILVFCLGLALTALSLMKRVKEPEGGNRWVWMSAAAGLASFWAIIVLLLTMRIR